MGFAFTYHKDTVPDEAFMRDMMPDYHDKVIVICAYNFAYEEDVPTLHIQAITSNHRKHGASLKKLMLMLMLYSTELMIYTYPWKTIRENIDFRLRITGIDE